LFSSGNNMLTDNVMEKCGIVIHDSTNNFIDTSNKVNGKSVRYFENDDSIILSDELDVGQVILVNCTNFVIENLEIKEASIGIYLYSSSNNIISGNNCSFNGYGIYLSYSSNNNTISGNRYSFNGCGINLRYQSDYNTIAGNNCSFNDDSGIYLYSSSNNIISGNNCSFNGYGIYLYASSNNIISGNNCSFNEYGIYLKYYSHYNGISSNNCSNNGCGIRLSDSSNNIFWKNYFINNPLSQVYYSGSSVGNQWNFNGQGNYWGDYETRYPEAINDGYVWNTPYEIVEGIYDEFPLVIPDNTFPTWDETPTDQTLLVDDSLSYDVSASDNVEIDSYWLNDTSNFQIDANGLLTNRTDLAIGTYSIEVHVNDTSGNEIVAEFNIFITDDEPTDDEPTDDEPTDDEPTDDEPTDDEPTDDEPTDDEPTDDESNGEKKGIPGYSLGILFVCLSFASYILIKKKNYS